MGPVRGSPARLPHSGTFSGSCFPQNKTQIPTGAFKCHVLLSRPQPLGPPPSRAPSGLFAGSELLRAPHLLLWLSTWKEPPPRPCSPFRSQLLQPPSRSTGLRLSDPASGGSQPPHLPYFLSAAFSTSNSLHSLPIYPGFCPPSSSDVKRPRVHRPLVYLGSSATSFSEPRGADANHRMCAWQSEVCGVGDLALPFPMGPRNRDPWAAPGL